MKVNIIAFSSKGCEIAKTIRDKLKNNDIRFEAYYKTKKIEKDITPVKEKLVDWTGKSFNESDAIIFIGATGIAIRSISPYLNSKVRDPAIICIDEKGQYVISLLSGHIGGGNKLTNLIAEFLGSTPIITTATDINELFSVDTYASENGYFIEDTTKIKIISAKILNGETVGLCSAFPILGDIPKELTLESKGNTGIAITNDPDCNPYDVTIKLIPKNIVLGLGCRRESPSEQIFDFVTKILKENSISIHSLKKIVSIDIKKDEKGLLEFCKKISVPSEFYTAEQLLSIDDPNITPSDFVKSITGVDNVCERSALFGSENGEIILRKVSLDGVTLALVKEKTEVRFDE